MSEYTVLPPPNTSPTIAMTGSIQKYMDVAATSTGKRAISTVPVSSTIFCQGTDERSSGQQPGQSVKSRCWGRGKERAEGRRLNLLLRRAPDPDVGKVPNPQIIRNRRQRNVFNAGFVAFLEHLRADVVRRVAAGKAHANVAAGEQVGQVVEHKKVAKERVAEADEIRSLLVASNTAAASFGELIGGEAEGVTLGHDLNLATAGTVPRRAEVLGKGRGCSVSNGVGREPDAYGAGLEQGREMHTGRKQADAANLEVRKSKRVAKGISVLKVVRKHVEHDGAFNNSGRVVAAQLKLAAVERGDYGKLLRSQRKKAGGLIAAANDEGFN